MGWGGPAYLRCERNLLQVARAANVGLAGRMKNFIVRLVIARAAHICEPAGLSRLPLGGKAM